MDFAQILIIAYGAKSMDFNNLQALKYAGFTGFKTIRELSESGSAIPKVKGYYLVLSISKKPPEFLTKGTGGFFKGRDPNVPVSILKENWVDNTIVVYIGKAGKDGSQATLHSRLCQYFGFGRGGNIGHWGGRFIWQLKDSQDLIVCWKELASEDPRTLEAALIKEFIQKYNKRPFANLAD